ncbi:ubiquitin-like protein 4A isoform X1 [Polypterus senegalus]|uniref:ubiquitin-like protein 4A isoform X1 n=1 Tax=Polypterus senegalus TaxID=55291 RepID=UPI0019654343|nr:ubiquitin-like protein 4A isoform X1 [Polypterus senegalus]
MLLTVKPLQGKECCLQICIFSQVSENETILNVKHLVSERLNIPVLQQRLLYKGKALSDEHRLSDYAIGQDSKLNLVIKPSAEKPSPEDDQPLTSSPSSVWHSLPAVINKHFSPADATKVLEQLHKDYECSLRQLSLDDIERLATRLLHPEAVECMNVSFLD